MRAVSVLDVRQHIADTLSGELFCHSVQLDNATDPGMRLVSMRRLDAACGGDPSVSSSWVCRVGVVAGGPVRAYAGGIFFFSLMLLIIHLFFIFAS